MRRRLCTLLLLSILGACGVHEGANHGARCDQSEPCPVSEVCYRGFCIADPQSAVALDAASSVPVIDSGAVSPDEASSPVDSNGGGPGDATVQSGPVVPPVSASDASSVPGLELDPDASAALSDASVAPPLQSVPDAGPVAPTPMTVDAGPNYGSAELLLCLGVCAATRSPICLACVGPVLMRNPMVCSAAERRKDLTVNGLCEIACTTQLCRGGQ